MNRRPFIVAAIALLLMFCRAKQETTTTTSTTSTQSTVTEAAPSSATTTIVTQTAAPIAVAAPTSGSLASQETNWPGVTADVTEFRRKGNTLTAKLRFSNKGSEEPEVQIQWDQVYLIDTAGGKKYEPLKDQNQEYIAALNPGWKDRWYVHLKPGTQASIWVKFPAPPAEVKAITLNIPKTAPFEDIAIQE